MYNTHSIIIIIIIIIKKNPFMVMIHIKRKYWKMIYLL